MFAAEPWVLVKEKHPCCHAFGLDPYQRPHHPLFPSLRANWSLMSMQISSPAGHVHDDCAVVEEWW